MKSSVQRQKTRYAETIAKNITPFFTIFKCQNVQVLERAGEAEIKKILNSNYYYVIHVTINYYVIYVSIIK